MTPLVPAKEAATLLAIGSRKLWELTNCGEIPHVRIGRAIRYDVADLEQWILLRKRRGLSDAHCKSSAPRSTSRAVNCDQDERERGAR